MRLIVATVLCCMVLLADAQMVAHELRFMPWFGDHALKLDADERLDNGAVIHLTQLRFYVGIPVVPDDGEASLLPYSYHLIDAAEPATWTVELQRSKPSYFLLGVDSLTNVSGALGGDLDPTKGMYWTWNSGYINFKLEGTSPTCPTRGKEFQFHLGGYLPPYASALRVTLPPIAEGPIEIRVDIAAFLAGVDLANEHNVMSPGEKAVRLSQLAASIFTCHVVKP